MSTTVLDDETITRDALERTNPQLHSRPLGLSDSQLDAIRDAAEPLLWRDRSAFLEDVANALRGHEIGDGIVGRVVREAQRRYLNPPDLSRGRTEPRSRRKATAG